MRILITSGGTTVPIDPVRNISNSSTGKFGAELARRALMTDAEVTYLVSTQGQSPFSCQVDFYQSTDRDKQFQQVQALRHFVEQYQAAYHEYRYQHFNDYAVFLKKIISKDQPDIVILAAAVSDYLVNNYSPDKIRSSEQLALHLESAPKLINAIKQWSPTTFLVGFKLLIEASDAELIEAAIKSMQQHQADLVVANNLASLKKGAHEIILVERDGSFQKYTENLASSIIARVLRRKGGALT